MFISVRRGIGRFISWFIPATTKKMIVLTGATTTLEKNEEIERNRDRFVRLLNEKMDLATQQDSMLFALEIGRILWKDVRHRVEEAKLTREMLAEAIYEDCPDSLKYAEREVMVQDIGGAIHFIEAYS